jgi:hypothetical protein
VRRRLLNFAAISLLKSLRYLLGVYVILIVLWMLSELNLLVIHPDPKYPLSECFHRFLGWHYIVAIVLFLTIVLKVVLHGIEKVIAILSGADNQRKRGEAGFCLTCGYNLTGNTSGVCPECGTPVAGKAEVKA